MLDKETFSQRLNGAIEQLFSLTGQHCFNELSPNVRFIQRFPVPELSQAHSGMDALDAEVLKERLGRAIDLLTKEEIVNLLFRNGRVPGYINTTVLGSLPEMTVVELLISRGLKPDEQLYHRIDKHPPFHVLISIPPDKSSRESDGVRWDVNWDWERRYPEAEKPSMLQRIRSALFSPEHTS
jgi:hypothetical protein